MTSDQAILRTTIVPGSRRGRAHGHRRRRRSRRALRDRARLSPVGRAASRTSTGVWPGSSMGGYDVVKGVLETLYDALGLELRVARGSHALLHPGKAAETEAGWLGELHPTLLDGTWGAFELDLETLFATVPERVVYEDVITYPATLQDIAVAVDEDVEVGALVDAAHEAAGELLREARVFDVYRGDQVGPGPQVGRDPPGLPVARANAHRGGGDGARVPRSSRRSPSASTPSYARRPNPISRERLVEGTVSRIAALACAIAAASLVGAVGGSARAGADVAALRNRRSRLHDQPPRCLGRARLEARSRCISHRGRRLVRRAQLPSLGSGREPRDRDRRDRQGDLDGHLHRRDVQRTPATRTPGR